MSSSYVSLCGSRASAVRRQPQQALQEPDACDVARWYVDRCEQLYPAPQGPGNKKRTGEWEKRERPAGARGSRDGGETSGSAAPRGTRHLSYRAHACRSISTYLSLRMQMPSGWVARRDAALNGVSLWEWERGRRFSSKSGRRFGAGPPSLSRPPSVFPRPNGGHPTPPHPRFHHLHFYFPSSSCAVCRRHPSSFPAAVTPPRFMQAKIYSRYGYASVPSIFIVYSCPVILGMFLLT